MRLRQIEVFHAVYANGSISGAARALNVSQPAASRVLRHTESQLGITLFQLVRGRLVPTDEAHALFREVDEVYGRISSLRQTARNMRGGGAGHLRIGAVPSLALEIVPAAIARFHAHHPDVTFEIQTLHHDAMVQSLYERVSDLAIGYDPTPNPRMELRQLDTAEMVLISRAGTVSSSADPLPLSDLDGRDIVRMATNGPAGDVAAEALAREDVSVREVASVGTYYVAASLVRHGCAAALVDEFTASAACAEGLDVHRLAPAVRFGVYVAWLEGRPLSILADRFVTQLSDIMHARAPISIS